MSTVKIIKTEKEYQRSLRRIEALMDAPPGSARQDELELLALLVDHYEAEHFPIDMPDPVEAILFRMEQQGLTPKDMIPYLGSQSKVSEVLNYKRPLSLAMIRSLHQGLGIPAEVLIHGPAGQREAPTEPDPEPQEQPFFYNCAHLASQVRQASLKEWYLTTLKVAQKHQLPSFEGKNVSKALFDELVRLSAYSAGPQMACELLNKKGIQVVVQKIAREIDLDGAFFITPGKQPVIALTMRKDRLDEFWFTLLHLLAHLYLHPHEKPVVFFDSVECALDKDAPRLEARANEVLKAALAPSPGEKKLLESTLQSGDKAALAKTIHRINTSPEMLACWARLENQATDPYTALFTPKKVSEKLEVYRASET